MLDFYRHSAMFVVSFTKSRKTKPATFISQLSIIYITNVYINEYISIICEKVVHFIHFNLILKLDF